MTDLDTRSADAPPSTVKISPSDIVRRNIASWRGIQVDSVELTRREPLEYELRSTSHLLIVTERAERNDGETQIEGLPTSTLREFSQKLSFVPAGHRFFGWQDPRVLTRVTYIYIDPAWPWLASEPGFPAVSFRPRLFFFDQDIWTTALKLKAQAQDSGSPGYVEALSTVLAHELMRLNNGMVSDTPLRGGLATWQRRRIVQYIEDHITEAIPLLTLARIAQLSPYHFSRAFKHSFGEPPHRYHTSRRMALAKELLATPARSVTEIGLKTGFSETSSFTAAFRRSVGMTPTDYRRANR